MKIGEVGLLTNDVPTAAFYKQLLEIEMTDNDETISLLLPKNHFDHL